ncbi:hypothetical protein TVAGG3_0773120 [Trichomonas vaginalis G3]|uniref:hypothetical protein n=1 Tax=Trichomonas vaginalis (strain ATCC PRA-98 / G3) TaxID=412133 RepID=UPI0021E61F42|nr:hypothetical protein TVAGG3_0773120 [Trichomonas vaginalis G3]KAI5513964.1 hypothetical protein TVAGG3_0773120 [Trichomonas vaginalis G3]
MVGPWIMLTERALASKANVIDYFEKAYQDLHYIREVRKYLIENDLDDDARKKLEKELKDVAENYFPKQEKDMISSVITISDGLKLFREIFDEGNYTELINMLDGLSMILSSDTLIASDEFLINYSIQSFNISVFKRDKSFSDVALYRELLEFHPSIKKEFPFEVKDDTVFIRASHLSDEALKFNWKHLEKNQSVFANLMLALLSRCGSDIHLPIMNGKIPLIKFECEYKDEVQKINLQKTELSNMTRSECVAFITNQLFGGDSNKANFFNSGAATEFFQIIYPDMNDFYLLFIDSRIDDIKAHFESKEKSELIPPEEFEKIITSPSNIETLLNQSGTPNSNLVAQGSSMNSKDYSLSSSCEEEQKEPEDINDFLKTFGKDKSKDYLVKKPKITALDEVKLRIDAIKNHELSEKIDIELCYKGFIVSFQCDRNTSKEKIVGEAKRRFISLQNIQDDYIIFSIPGLSTSINNADLIDFLKTKSYLKLNVHIRKPSYIN